MERKTAGNLLIELERVYNSLQDPAAWATIVTGLVTDASGEARKARRLFSAKYPHVIVLDCYSHQVGLIIVYSLSQKKILIIFSGKLGCRRFFQITLYSVAIHRDGHGAHCVASVENACSRTSHALCASCGFNALDISLYGLSAPIAALPHPQVDPLCRRIPPCCTQGFGIW